MKLAHPLAPLTPKTRSARFAGVNCTSLMEVRLFSTGFSNPSWTHLAKASLMETSNDLVRVVLFAEVLDGLDVCDFEVGHFGCGFQTVLLHVVRYAGIDLWVEVPT